jgi:hypothetical protein
MPRFQVQGGGALLTINMQGEKQLAGFIPGIANKIGDLTAIWDEYDALLRGHVKGRFRTKGGQREPWPPLALSTIIAKRKAKAPAAPLIRTRALITALTQTGGGHVLVKSKKSMTFGEDEGYGDYHQSPLVPRRRLSRRAFFYIGPKETTKMIGILRRHVEGEK